MTNSTRIEDAELTIHHNNSNDNNDAAEHRSVHGAAVDGMVLGGKIISKIKKPAFCLLDGFQEDDSSRVTFPIFRLPATLGRSLDVNIDKNFIGMGLNKCLSRQHVQIQWLIPTSAGGCGQVQSKKKKCGDQIYFNPDDPTNVNEVIKCDTTKQLPDTGFWAITCLSKNRIVVNRKRVEQGQTCWLESGASIRIGAFALYFLTPTNSSNTIVEVRDDVEPSKKRRISLGGNKSGMTVSTALKPVVTGSGTGDGIEDPERGKKKVRMSMPEELELLSTKELMKQLSDGIANDVWDRRQQVIGATISYRAVLSATRSPELQQLATENNGELLRTEIMDWIADSERYGGWVEQMLSKIEEKSYQMSITKAMLKAGFERTSTHGRYIKWTVPSDLYTPPIEEKVARESNDDRKEDFLESTMLDGDDKTFDEDIEAVNISLSHPNSNQNEVQEEYRADTIRDDPDDSRQS